MDENTTDSPVDLNTTSIPIILLKTESTPHDEYARLFRSAHLPTTPSSASISFHPTFVRPLAHALRPDTIQDLASTLPFYPAGDNGPPPPSSRHYAGLIITSQRAVEALSSVAARRADADGGRRQVLPPDFPVYVVGPATARAVRALTCEAVVLGEETGSGERLAKFIIEHFNGDDVRERRTQREGEEGQETREAPLLFVVGEKRRDVIPRALQSEDLAADRRIRVVEREVYSTRLSEKFGEELEAVLRDLGYGRRHPVAWVVVFSPQGCETMLEVIGKVTGEASRDDADVGLEDARPTRHIKVATIGPTTRDYLVEKCGIQPDVCSERPDPSGLLDGISKFMTENGREPAT